ncbi:MAG: radical SAM protein [Prevotellaceae bacterium]|jgi:MoaA/NifB/PqqE/SkfB family radical SAM enzyme|nr:radical SAM protein [Prevotellaceae bacterium]
MAKQLFYLPWWFARARFMGRRRPLQTVLFISDRCNLQCKHCSVYNLANPVSKTAAQIREELEYSYRLGSRFVDFEGGEPMLWRDGELRINDLIRMAKEIGFFSTTVTTNAQMPFEGCEADSIWVSLDGYGEHHDFIRGKGTFARLEENVEKCHHPNVSFNMVINSENYGSVRQTIEYANNNPAIRAISLNFHTPYAGTEYLFLDWPLRVAVIDEIIQMKRAGYPIINSVSGLKLMKHNRFSKQCWVSNFILADGTRLAECPGSLEKGICEQCGFGMAGEMHSVFTLRPDTILAGMKLRM